MPNGYGAAAGPTLHTNDFSLFSLQVREIVSECQCPTQFPMIRVSEGKYRIGDTQTLIFVRVSPKRCELCKYIFIAKKLVGNACTYLEKYQQNTATK